MSKQANPTVIGGFVLGALVIIVIAILTFSSGALMRERIRMVTYFPGSVQGLTVGAQVQFQGVPIGQVTNISVDYVADRDSFRIPVDYEIWPRQVHVLGGDGTADVREVLERLIDEKGLRARLESISFVTGQYLVALSLNPELPRRPYEGPPSGPIRVPAIAATRDQVEEMLQNLDLDGLVDNASGTLGAIRKLVESGAVRETIEHLNGTLAESQQLLKQLNTNLGPLSAEATQALDDYAKLARTLAERSGPLLAELEQASKEISGLAENLDSRVGPLADAATGALDEAGRAMRSITSLTGSGSSTRQELERVLTEAGRAARSLRLLADYLERHPEALLKGKR